MSRTAHTRGVSVNDELNERFMKTPGHPSLAELLDKSMREWLLSQGVEVPPKPAPSVTAAATAARWRDRESAPVEK